MTAENRTLTVRCNYCGVENSIEDKAESVLSMLAKLDAVHDTLRPDCEAAKRRAGSVG